MRFIEAVLPIIFGAFLLNGCQSSPYVVEPKVTPTTIATFGPKTIASQIGVTKTADYKNYMPLEKIQTWIKGNSAWLRSSDESFSSLAKRILEKEFTVHSVETSIRNLDDKDQNSEDKDSNSSDSKPVVSVELIIHESYVELGKTFVSSGTISVTVKPGKEDRAIWNSKVILAEIVAPAGNKVAVTPWEISAAFDRLIKAMEADGLFKERKMIKIF